MPSGGPGPRVRRRPRHPRVGMQVAIVTGASRGLGLELVRALSAQGWRVVADARGADELHAAVGSLDGVTALAGRRHGRPAPPGARRRRRAAARPAREQREHARREPAAAARSATRWTSWSASSRERRRAAGARPAGAAAARRRAAAIVNVSSDAGVEAYEGWGGYGASKAALDQLSRVLAAERPDLARLRGRPRRHEHRHAPGGVSRARTSPTGRRRPSACPGCCGCSRRCRRAGATPSTTLLAEVAVIVAVRAARRAGGRPAARGARPAPRPGAAARRRGRLARCATRASTSCRRSCAPATCSSSTPRRRCRPRSPARRRARGRARASLDPARRRPLGRRAAPPARPGHEPLRSARAGEVVAARRTAARSSCSGRRPGGGCGRRGSPCPAATCSRSSPATASRSATGTWAARGRSTSYQTVFAVEPGQRRDAERRPRVHARARHGARRARRRASRR